MSGINKSPSESAIVLSAPQGWGKTRNKKALMREFGVSKVIDDWSPDAVGAARFVHAETLHLTSSPPETLKHLRCKVILRGWD